MMGTNNNTTDPASGSKNHVAEIIDVAHGRMLKSAYADLLSVHATRISQLLPSHYERAIRHLQAENDQLQVSASDLQVTCKSLQVELDEAVTHKADLQESESQLQAIVGDLKAVSSRVQADASRLQVENADLQGDLKAAQNLAASLKSSADAERERANRLASEVAPLQTNLQKVQADFQKMQLTFNRWNANPKMLKVLGSSHARAVLLLFLAAFEVVGTFTLLQPKGEALAYPASIGLGFALLVFTASENRLGRWFIIAYAFALGGIFFDVFPNWSNWLFAFTPPTVAAILANSFNRGK